MSINKIWVFGFLLLYSLHVVSFFLRQERFGTDIPPYLGLIGMTLTLIFMLTMIVADFLKRDEVVRHMALIGGTAAAIISSLYSFVIDILSIKTAFPVWAVSIIIFLIVYGGLQWRARS